MEQNVVDGQAEEVKEPKKTKPQIKSQIASTLVGVLFENIVGKSMSMVDVEDIFKASLDIVRNTPLS